MRRPVSPRYVIASEFKSLEKAINLAKEDPTQDKIDLVLDRMRSAREISVSFAADMPALKPVEFKRRLDLATPQGVMSFVGKHIKREVRLLDIEGVDPDALSAAATASLSKIDEDGDLELEIMLASQDVISRFPGIISVEYSVEKLNSVMRESVGLDGTVVDPDIDQDLVNENVVRAITAVKSAQKNDLVAVSEEEVVAP